MVFGATLMELAHAAAKVELFPLVTEAVRPYWHRAVSEFDHSHMVLPFIYRSRVWHWLAWS